MHASRYSMLCTRGPFGDRTVASAFAGPPPRPAGNPDDRAPQARRSRRRPSTPHPSVPARSSPPLSCWRFNGRVPAPYALIHPEKSLISHSIRGPHGRRHGQADRPAGNQLRPAPLTTASDTRRTHGLLPHERSANRVELRMDARTEGEPPARASVETLAATRHHAAKARCQPEESSPTFERKYTKHAYLLKVCAT